MRDTRIRLFMQMELMVYIDELDWLIRCYHFESTTIQKSTVHRWLWQSLPIIIKICVREDKWQRRAFYHLLSR